MRQLLAEIMVNVLIAAVMLMAVLAFSIALQGAQARPYYTSTTRNMIFLKIMPVDPTGKSNNCWTEIYARATPKNSNHVLLNKETIINPSPDNGPSRNYLLKWYFNVNTFHSTDTTNEGKIRTYAYLELKIGNSPTVTKYLPLSQSKITTVDGRTVSVLDFGTYRLVTDPTQCS